MYMNLYRYRVNRDDKHKDMQFQRIIFLEIVKYILRIRTDINNLFLNNLNVSCDNTLLFVYLMLVVFIIIQTLNSSLDLPFGKPLLCI